MFASRTKGGRAGGIWALMGVLGLAAGVIFWVALPRTNGAEHEHPRGKGGEPKAEPEGGHGDEHGKGGADEPVSGGPAVDMAGAAHEFHAARCHLADAIARRVLDKAAEASSSLRTAAAKIEEGARKESSGVSAGTLEKMQAASKAISIASEKLDKAAGGKNLEGVAAAYKELAPRMDELLALAGHGAGEHKADGAHGEKGHGEKAGEHGKKEEGHGHGEPAKEKEDGGGHGQDGKPAEAKMDFASYGEALQAVGHHFCRVADLIARRDLAGLHSAAQPIKKIAKDHLAELAMKDGSGVPEDAIKAVNKAARALAATWDKLDEAGDSNNLEGSEKVYVEMAGLIDELAKHAKPAAAGDGHDGAGHGGHEHPKAAFRCPMKCEDDKTYAAAGKCPVCGMDTREVKK